VERKRRRVKVWTVSHEGAGEAKKRAGKKNEARVRKWVRKKEGGKEGRKNFEVLGKSALPGT
jgi:hypothetical protein